MTTSETDTATLDRNALSTILATLPAPAAVVEMASGQYIALNQQFSELSGWPVESVIGRTSVDLGLWCSPLDRRRYLRDRHRDGSGYNRMHRRDGEVRSVCWSSRLVQVDGEDAILVVAQDTTDRLPGGDGKPAATPHIADLLSSPKWKLTPREAEVAQLVHGGHQSAEIAELLGISTHAVTYHRYNIRQKLGLNNRGINLMLHLRHLTTEAEGSIGNEDESPNAAAGTDTERANTGALLHRINNLLMAIIASTELIRVEFERGTTPNRWIEEIETAANRLGAIAAQALEPDCDETSDDLETQPSTSSRASAITGATVLVADDEPLVRTTLVSLLEQLGCTVIVADGGRSATTAVRDQTAIDCVLLDYDMPDMDGLAAMEKIATVRPDLPVAIISGCSSAEIRSQLGDGHSVLPRQILPKPIRLQQLKSALRELLQDNRH